MAKLQINFSKNVIYKIVCKNLDITECYVGHTTDFNKRKNVHKTRCNNENTKFYNFRVYKFIRENGGWENWQMVEIEKFPCNDSREAGTRERYWYENLNSKLNCNVPMQTVSEYQKIYYAKPHVRQRVREYYNNYNAIKKSKSQQKCNDDTQDNFIDTHFDC